MDKKKRKMILIILGVAIVLLLGVALYIVFNNNDKEVDNDKDKPNNEQKEEVKKISIIDLESDSRPYAVMVNNLAVARPYHSGLQDAYLVYEIIVEGGITRLMAVFKDVDTTRIGSVRSARHYYLDYALENDAIYVHYGWSPQAQSDVSSLDVDNINGLYDSAFWRDTTLDVAYEHTAFTSVANIKKIASKKKYSLTSNKDTLLNYSVDEVNLSDEENSKVANSVNIKYSNYITTTYVYNEDEKVYYRSTNGNAHKDYITGKQYTTKNIIVALMSNDGISNDNKGRQELNNIGKGEGYYITLGYSIPITWEKSSRKAQTVYKTISGEEINVNDGNTYIQIAPLKSTTISE